MLITPTKLKFIENNKKQTNNNQESVVIISYQPISPAAIFFQNKSKQKNLHEI